MPHQRNIPPKCSHLPGFLDMTFRLYDPYDSKNAVGQYLSFEEVLIVSQTHDN